MSEFIGSVQLSSGHRGRAPTDTLRAVLAFPSSPRATFGQSAAPHQPLGASADSAQICRHARRDQFRGLDRLTRQRALVRHRGPQGRQGRVPAIRCRLRADCLPGQRRKRSAHRGAGEGKGPTGHAARPSNHRSECLLYFPTMVR
jgi:hypothetical protein